MNAEECKRQINKIKSDILKCEQKQRKLNQTLKNVKLKSLDLYLKEVVKPYVENGKIVLDGDYRKVVRIAFDRGLIVCLRDSEGVNEWKECTFDDILRKYELPNNVVEYDGFSFRGVVRYGLTLKDLYDLCSE